jgi:hypothetical protein
MFKKFFFLGYGKGWTFHYFLRWVFARFFDKNLIKVITLFLMKHLVVVQSYWFLKLLCDFCTKYPILVQGFWLFELETKWTKFYKKITH